MSASTARAEAPLTHPEQGAGELHPQTRRVLTAMFGDVPMLSPTDALGVIGAAGELYLQDFEGQPVHVVDEARRQVETMGRFASGTPAEEIRPNDHGAAPLIVALSVGAVTTILEQKNRASGGALLAELIRDNVSAPAEDGPAVASVGVADSASPEQPAVSSTAIEESWPEISADRVFDEVFSGLPAARRDVIWERALVYILPKYAAFVRKLSTGTAGRPEAAAAVGLDKPSTRDALRVFRDIGLALRDDNFDPIEWQRVHRRTLTARNVFYFCAASGEKLSPDDRRPVAYARAHDSLERRIVDAETKALVVRAFGLDGNPPQSISSLAKELGVQYDRLHCRIQDIFTAPFANVPRPIGEQLLQCLLTMFGGDERLGTVSQNVAVVLMRQAARMYSQAMQRQINPRLSPAGREGVQTAINRNVLAMDHYASGRSVDAIGEDVFNGDAGLAQQAINEVMGVVAGINEAYYNGKLAEVLIANLKSTIAESRAARVHKATPAAGTAVMRTRGSEVTEHNWRDWANCRDADPEIFFPHRWNRAASKPARTVCHGCAVRARCLQYALEGSVEFGVWGGVPEKERRAIRRKAQVASSPLL